jgi:hypothetical protein
MSETDYSNAPYMWYPIGVGNTGSTILNAFFRSLDSNGISLRRINKSLAKETRVNLPGTLSEHILTQSVPGVDGWWAVDTYQHLDKMFIFERKLNHYLRPESSISSPQTKKVLLPLKKESNPIPSSERLRFANQYFTLGFQEGAGTSWLLGDRNSDSVSEEVAGVSNIEKILDVYEKKKWREADAMLMVHGLGGGIGSAATGRLNDVIKQIDPEPHPMDIITLSLLPDLDENDSYYHSTIVNTLFGILSVIQNDKGKRNAENIILVHGPKLAQLVRRKRTPFLYADPFPFLGNKFIRRINFKKPSAQAVNGMIIDLLGLLCSGNLQAFDCQGFDVTNLIQQTNNLFNSERCNYPEIPAVLVPVVYISPEKKATPSTLIKSALEPNNDWAYVQCNPETARQIYCILFFDNATNNLDKATINKEVRNAIKEVCPNFKGSLALPNYVDTAGTFSACLLFLNEPKLPILNYFYEQTCEIFSGIKREKRASSSETSDVLQMKALWEEKGEIYKERAEHFFEVINK